MGVGTIPVYCIYSHIDHSPHSPLAMAMVVAAARHGSGSSANDRFQFVPTPTAFGSALEIIRRRGPGVLLCSDYVWTERANRRLAAAVKQLHPRTVAIHGGPSVPKYDYAWREYFTECPAVDIAVHGEGEATLLEVLERLADCPDPLDRDGWALATVRGITYRGAHGIDHTADRQRIAELDELPSPYLDGFFSPADASAWVAAIVETNRGCPYGCTFCDWGSATLSKIRKFGMDRVRAEIEWTAKQHVPILWVADANFGIFERDVEIAEWIAACRRRHGYPRQVVVNYAKNATKRLAEIVRIFAAAAVRADAIVAIQTHDPQTLRNIDRANIKTERYEELIAIFRRENLPISTDLIFALPGSTIDTLKRDIQFFFDRKIYAKLHPAQVLVNSPMAHRDYMQRFAITVDDNGYVTSTFSCTPSDVRTMRALRDWYMLLVGYGLLKYFLYYLQVDHGIEATVFMHALANEVESRGNRWPGLSGLLRAWTGVPEEEPYECLLRSRRLEDWSAFYADVRRLAQETYGVLDPALDDVLLTQAKLMPGTDRVVPEVVSLSHDVVAYFQAIASVSDLTDLKTPEWKPLSMYPAGLLQITDPYGLCDVDHEAKATYDVRGLDWELSSGLRQFEVADPFVLPETSSGTGPS